MPDWLIILLIVLGSLSLLICIYYVIVINVIFHLTFTRRKGDKDFAKHEDPRAKNSPDRIWYFSHKIEELNLKSFDGLNLKGYFISQNSHKLAVMVHGYHGRYYSLVSQAKIFYENGYDLLNINNRVHDTSEGKYLSMGIKEKCDLLDWLKYMLNRNPNYEIVLFGISMGAFISMLTVCDSKIPANLKCIVADCGYSSIKKQLVFALRGTRIPFLKCVVNILDWHCRMFHHFSINYDLKKELKELNIPILFMHGTADAIVPCENTDINYEYVNEKVYKEKHFFVGAKHTKCVENYAEYKTIVNSFVNRFVK